MLKNTVQTSTSRQDEVTGIRFTHLSETTRNPTECIEQRFQDTGISNEE